MLLLLACTKADPVVPDDALTVWNQAYATPDRARDSVEDILAEARDAYVLVDPFDLEGGSVQQIHDLGNQVACYISVGTCEDWREDHTALAPACSDTEWPDWPGEFGVSDPEAAAPHMKARIDQAAAWGCDWVELDNMDWYEDDEIGAEVSADEGLAYVLDLCQHIRDAGMRCMAKSIVPSDDFAGGTWETSPGETAWMDAAQVRDLTAQGLPAVFMHYEDRDCEGSARALRDTYGSSLSVLCSTPGPTAHYERW